jgi:hypothetical protein
MKSPSPVQKVGKIKKKKNQVQGEKSSVFLATELLLLEENVDLLERARRADFRCRRQIELQNERRKKK